MFFIKIRHDWPDKMLELFFGVSDGTAANYVDEVTEKMCEVTEKICESFVPRLFYLPKPEGVVPRIPQKFRDAYPTVFFIGDATHKTVPVPENASHNSLAFCVYKWVTTVQMVFCKMSGCMVFDFHESSLLF
jgi:hypothetical protein